MIKKIDSLLGRSGARLQVRLYKNWYDPLNMGSGEGSAENALKTQSFWLNSCIGGVRYVDRWSAPRFKGLGLDCRVGYITYWSDSIFTPWRRDQMGLWAHQKNGNFKGLARKKVRPSFLGKISSRMVIVPTSPKTILRPGNGYKGLTKGLECALFWAQLLFWSVHWAEHGDAFL